ncbi:MAG: hypothetical protein AAFW95_07435, partial [Cyanobacteria bacterium J06638_6]
MFRLLRLRRPHPRLLLSVLPLALLVAMAAPSCAQAACACLDEGREVPLSLPVEGMHNAQLLESWQAYRTRFIQPDGRVIDREDSDR